MAVVQDIIEETFKFTGLPQAVVGLNATTAATAGLATATTAATAATATLSAALATLAANPLVAVGAALAAVTGGIATAVRAFGEADLQTARLERQMANLGNVFPVDQLQRFAGELSRVTGIDDELIASLGGTAARFGLLRSQIERLLPTVLDISAATGIDPQQVLQTVLRASRGRPQGLVALGIDPSKIRGDVKNIDNLLAQLDQHFKGSAQDVRQTVPGAIEALQTSFSNLLEAMGRLFGGTTVSLINKLINIIDVATDLINRLADFLEKKGIIAPRVAPAAGAGDLALKGDPEQTALLGQIASNTDPKNGLVSRVLGGPGQVASRAVTWRDVGIALRI